MVLSHRVLPREAIILILMWFRIATLCLVAILMLIGATDKLPLPLMMAFAYNAVILVFWRSIVKRLLAWPYLISIDVIIALLLMLASSGRESPYYLYSFSPLVLGSFLFGYRGAFLLSGLQSVLFIVIAFMDNQMATVITNTDKNITTDIFFFFLTGISLAYMDDQLERLDEARKEACETNLERNRLKEELSLKLSCLSHREIEVFTLMSKGMTNEEIAQELDISKSTVRTYLNRIYMKLKVTSRNEAIAQALKQEKEVETD